MRALLVLALVLALPLDARAGKKRKKKDEAAAPTTEAPAAAPDEGVAIGRPAGGSVVDVPCPFTEGATKTWRKVETVGGRSPRRQESTVVLTVVEADEASVVVDVGGEVVSITTDDPVFQSLIDGIDDVELVPRVRYEHASMELTVLNLEAALAAYAAVADQVVQNLPADAPPQVGDSVRAMLAEPAMVHQMVTAELVPLFQYTCGVLPVGQPQQYVTQLPNPFGGEPLPAQGSLEIQQKSPTVLLARNVEQLDPGAARALLEPLIAKLGPDVPPEVREELGALPLDVRTEMVVEVGADTGWILSLRSLKTIRGPGHERVDELTITLE